MKRQRGVSLTEMLVCLVIIAILVGLLSPVFSKTKASAKQVGDVSNMRQIYAALQLYKADNGDYPLRSNPQPVYKTYLGGTKLICTNGKQDHYEYRLYGPHDILVQLGRLDESKYYEACRDKREGQWPLIQDTNHTSVIEDAAGSGAFLLLVRESGAVDRIGSERLKSFSDSRSVSAMPCPNGATTFIDINY